MSISGIIYFIYMQTILHIFVVINTMLPLYILRHSHVKILVSVDILLNCKIWVVTNFFFGIYFPDDNQQSELDFTRTIRRGPARECYWVRPVLDRLLLRHIWQGSEQCSLEGSDLCQTKKKDTEKPRHREGQKTAYQLAKGMTPVRLFNTSLFTWSFLRSSGAVGYN